MSLYKINVKYGLAWCSGDVFEIYEFYPNLEMKKIITFEAYIKNKHKKGGQSQCRFQRLVDIQRNDFINKCVAMIEENMPPELQHIYIVGTGPKKLEIYNHLTITLRNKSTLITSDQNPLNIIKNLNLGTSRQNEKYINDFYDNIHKGLVVYGTKEVFKMLEGGMLRTVITTDETHRPLCEQYGTQCIINEQITELEVRLHREFGNVVGITRWKVNENYDDNMDIVHIQ
jgi:peptide subunit release factor 1 (eRF1)